MQEISAQSLETVAGGIKKNDLLLQQVTTSIKDLATSNTTNGSLSSTTTIMLMMAMQNRNQTVIAAPGYGCAPATSFSLRARVRF